jgi:hypothetical protein
LSFPGRRDNYKIESPAWKHIVGQSNFRPSGIGGDREKVLAAIGLRGEQVAALATAGRLSVRLGAAGYGGRLLYSAKFSLRFFQASWAGISPGYGRF